MRFTEGWMEEVDLLKLEEWLCRIEFGFIDKARCAISDMNYGEAQKILIEGKSEISMLSNSIRAFNEERRK